MAGFNYQITITMDPLYTGTTEADNFTIIGKHCNGSPSDTIIATNVTKADLTNGVTYSIASTISGGTVTSTGTCTNSVPWVGLNNCTPTPTATEGGGGVTYSNHQFSIFCTTDGSNYLDAPVQTFIVNGANCIGFTGVNGEPGPGDYATIPGGPNQIYIYQYVQISAENQTVTSAVATTSGDCIGELAPQN